MAVGPLRWHGGIGNSPYSVGSTRFWVDRLDGDGVVLQGRAANVQEVMMKVLKRAALLAMAVLGLMAGGSALALAAPDTRADATYLKLLDQNGVSSPNPEIMVSFAHDLVGQLSATPQTDATVGSIVHTGEQRFSQHDMGVII